jgi:hypothetical protein
MFTVIVAGFCIDFSCSAKSMVRTVRFRAIPDKNLTVPALFFFGLKGETNYGTKNFFFGCAGS